MIVKDSINTGIDYMGLVMTYHDNMRDNRLNLVYEGEINQSITKAFTSLAEQNLNEENEEKAVVRKVYHVMVECLQNIYKHSDPLAPNSPGRRSHGIILIGHDDGGYIISTGNSIDKSKESGIKNLLDGINAMDREQLKESYKNQMKDGMLTEKGGAGLGFIDISRKTGSKLDYRFETIDEKNSFFILKTYIAK